MSNATLDRDALLASLPANLRMRLELRFLKHVQKSDGCWVWIGAVNPKGYGSFMLDGTCQIASRVAYRLFVGAIGEFHVLHRCDMPLCVNPAHLFLGTNADNVADRVQKGRSRGAAGERNCKAKLSHSDVERIRSLHAGGRGTVSLAREYGLHRNSIGNIVSGRYWT